MKKPIRPASVKSNVHSRAAKAVAAVRHAEEPDKTPPPDIDTVQSLAPYKKKLENLVSRRKVLDAQIKALEAQKKELSDAIMPILFRAKVDRVIIDGYPTRIVESGHNQLSKSKLIESGVDPQVIEDCTEYIKHSPYIRIDARKDDTEE